MYGHGPEVAARIEAWKKDLAAEVAAMEADGECQHPRTAWLGPGLTVTCQDCGRRFPLESQSAPCRCPARSCALALAGR